MLPNQLKWRPAPKGVLVYEHGRLTAAVNFLPHPVEVSIRGRPLIASDPLVRAVTGSLTLPANSGAWLDNLADL
jgi:hypothetical protein